MLISTASAVFLLDEGGSSNAPRVRFEGDVERVAEGRRTWVVALRSGDLVLLSDDGEQRVDTAIDASIESTIILEEDPLHLLIGTEGPHIYRYRAGLVGRNAAFDLLECRSEWYTPYGSPPELRSFAATRDGWVYADVHVGSIMRSSDLGVSWSPVTPELHADVHQVATSPVLPDRVYANTARAVYVSENRGDSWDHRARDLPFLYGRAIAVHPDEPDCLLATVSRGPGRNAEGRMFRSDDGGRRWTHVTKGFPSSTTGNIDTFRVAFSGDGQAWAAIDRRLFHSHDAGRGWEMCWEAPEAIGMIACRAWNAESA